MEDKYNENSDTETIAYALSQNSDISVYQLLTTAKESDKFENDRCVFKFFLLIYNPSEPV